MYSRAIPIVGTIACALACDGHRLSAAREHLDEAPEIPGLIESPLSVAEGAALRFAEAIAATDGQVWVGVPGLVEGETSSGGVLPFEVQQGEWQPGAPLLPPLLEEGRGFGAVLSANGSSLAVSSGYAPSGAAGRVWFYDSVTQTGAPISWDPPSDTPPQYGFGRALSLSHEVLAIGSESIDAQDIALGRAYVTVRTADGWDSLRPLTPPTDLAGEALFGWAIAADGDTVVVGAPYADSAGAVYVFQGADDWQSPIVLLGGGDAGAPANAAFGQAVALSGDRLFVGAPNEGDEFTGAVYPFQRIDGAWLPRTKIISRAGDVPDGAFGDAFGYSLGVALGRLWVGSPSPDPAAARVQAFALDGTGGELARLSPDPDAGVAEFGRTLGPSPSALVIGSWYRAYHYALGLGAPCASALDCPSRVCADGVCCDAPCEGGCETCLGEHQANGESGKCGPVAAGMDARDACERSSETCGTTGECDGAGACAFAPANTLCSEASCGTPATSVSQPRRCDGAGTCAPATEIPCNAGYACREGTCSTTCEEDAECDAAHYCLASECVSGRRCSGDRRTAYDESGKPSSCDRVLCKDGACPTSCKVTADCVVGVCHPERRTCEDPKELNAEPEASQGCGCRAVGGGNVPPWSGWLLAGCVLGLRQLRGRYGQMRKRE